MMIMIVSLAGCVVLFAAAYIIGFRLGINRGRDEQRIDDILELWSAMPDRDARGRFKSKKTDANKVSDGRLPAAS